MLLTHSLACTVTFSLFLFFFVFFRIWLLLDWDKRERAKFVIHSFFLWKYRNTVWFKALPSDKPFTHESWVSRLSRGWLEGYFGGRYSGKQAWVVWGWWELLNLKATDRGQVSTELLLHLPRDWNSLLQPQCLPSLATRLVLPAPSYHSI